jgi:hypothetical protein
VIRWTDEGHYESFWTVTPRRTRKQRLTSLLWALLGYLGRS